MSANLIACLVALAILAMLLSACAAGPEDSALELTAGERSQRIIAIAAAYAQSGDLETASGQLQALDVPNPRQSVLALAESHIAEGKDTTETGNLVGLAQALGPLSRMAADYLAQQGGQAPQLLAAAVQQPEPTATDTPLPPTATPEPPTATPEPTATPSPTPEPSATPTETPLPVPYAVAEAQGLNVRGGPGTAYPIVGEMSQGDEATILASNNDRSWWQISAEDGTAGWVYASLVTADGPLDQVVVAQNIEPPPTPRATAVPVQPPTATPAAAPAPPPAVPYAIVDLHLRPVGQDAQRCTGGDHNIWVTVIDANGAPLNGVRVREIYSGQIQVTGAQGKGDGRVLYDIYRGGGGVVEIVDEGNNPVSPQSRGMSADWPPFDLMSASGYCTCKPHPDLESCRADLESHNYFFAVGHYVYEVTFQRQY